MVQILLVREFRINYRQLSFACGYDSFIFVATLFVYRNENTQGKGGGNRSSVPVNELMKYKVDRNEPLPTGEPIEKLAIEQ